MATRTKTSSRSSQGIAKRRSIRTDAAPPRRPRSTASPRTSTATRRSPSARIGPTPHETNEEIGEDPDVLIAVPVVKVDSIHLEVDDLQAHVALKAKVLELVNLDVGVEVQLGQLQLDLKGVEAQALLKVRLDHIAAVVDRVFTTARSQPRPRQQHRQGGRGRRRRGRRGRGRHRRRDRGNRRRAPSARSRASARAEARPSRASARAPARPPATSISSSQTPGRRQVRQRVSSAKAVAVAAAWRTSPAWSAAITPPAPRRPRS